MGNRFWSVAELSNVISVEIEHYIPEDKTSLEAYDIKLRDPTHIWDFCMDVPPKVAEMIYEQLKKVLKK
ncbi:hypothetical protein LCGC14_1960170 [marine sediment metagenome]|uniref:Uncharacterized protein n=1 Tax=marine sediment metagenome TaxID=412755 RepID=A0A0F9G367_9ZZZZ